MIVGGQTIACNLTYHQLSCTIRSGLQVQHLFCQVRWPERSHVFDLRTLSFDIWDTVCDRQMAFGIFNALEVVLLTALDHFSNAFGESHMRSNEHN